jgi:hypothetical protein
MPKRCHEVTHYEIIELLKEIYKDDDTDINNVYKNYTSFKDIVDSETVEDISLKAQIENGKLPFDLGYIVDFIRVKTSKEPSDEDKEKIVDVNYYRLFLIVCSTKNTDELLKKIYERLVYYQFYFSSIAKIRTIELILVTPDYVNIQPELKDDFTKRGFGLYSMNASGRINPILEPISLREIINAQFVSALDDENFLKPSVCDISKELKKDFQLVNASLKGKADDFSTFYDQFIQDAVDAIAGINQNQIGRHFIDRKLMDLVSSKHNNDALSNIINSHLDSKTDDYEFALNCFKQLWKLEFNRKYPETLVRLDKFLQGYFPYYREHFVHQLQVYLIGDYLISLIGSDFIDSNKNDLRRSWLLASSFHDCAYPIQKFDDYMQYFFNECLSIEKLGALNLKTNYTEKSFSTSIEFIISYFFGNSPSLNTDSFNLMRTFFYSEITDNKNHGVLGGLGLIKRFKRKKGTGSLFNQVVLPASSAVLLHDDEIWQALSGMLDRSKRNKENEDIYNLMPLSNITLRNHPISFLLILCDNIQDWGRPCVDEELKKVIDAADIRFKEIRKEDNKLFIQLFFNHSSDPDCAKFISYKSGLISKMHNFLKSPEIEFIIEFYDNNKRNTDAKALYNYTIN